MKLMMALLFTVSTAFAGNLTEVKLAEITSNIDYDTGRFFLINDDNGDVDSVRYTNTAHSGRVNADQVYPWHQVLDGIILVERNGYEVLKLYLEPDFSPKTGGVIRINYLYNGATGVRYNKNLTLARNTESFFIKDGEKEINRMYIYGNWKVVLGLVGIASIDTLYTNPIPPYLP